MSIFEWLSENQKPVVLKIGDYNRSIVSILKKIHESSKNGDTERTAWLYQTISVMARRAGQWEDSIKYALLAVECSEREGRRFNAGWSYRSAAIAAGKKRDYKKAVEYAIKGADSFMLSESGYAAKWCYDIAAQACRDNGDLEDAMRFYKKGYSIEPDEETRMKIFKLKNILSHPTVDQYAEKEEVVEYEPVRFEVVVENHGDESIKNIMIGDKDARLTHDIASLGPGEVKVFSYETVGRLGYMYSPYNFMTWQNAKGKTLDMELQPASVLVRPKIQLNSYINPDPVINKKSELAITVKNLSSSPLYDVKLDAEFSQRVKAGKSSPNVFKKIAPGEEKGAEWEIEPVILGEQKIVWGVISMRDENGTEYEAGMPQVSARVLEAPHPEHKMFRKGEEFRLEKKHFDSSITAYPLSESQYDSLSKKLWHQQRGYTMSGVGVDVVTHHVEENARDMSIVSRHELEHERMMSYSFILDKVHYLLTVIVKEEEGFIHLVLKLYSENRENLSPVLKRVSDIMRYTINTETGAKEVEKVEIRKVINIIDSVVQRSKIGTGGGEGKATDERIRIDDSIVQRSEV